jgi:hypothetical protein
VRSGEQTPITFTRPARTVPSTELIAAIPSGTCPPMTSICSGPAPLYGTGVIFTRALEKKKCAGSTFPGVPIVSSPGRARASATSSLGVPTGSDGCAKIICGETMTSVTGTRSFRGS